MPDCLQYPQTCTSIEWQIHTWAANKYICTLFLVVRYLFLPPRGRQYLQQTLSASCPTEVCGTAKTRACKFFYRQDHPMVGAICVTDRDRQLRQLQLSGELHISNLLLKEDVFIAQLYLQAEMLNDRFQVVCILTCICWHFFILTCLFYHGLRNAMGDLPSESVRHSGLTTSDAARSNGRLGTAPRRAVHQCHKLVTTKLCPQPERCQSAWCTRFVHLFVRGNRLLHDFALVQPVRLRRTIVRSCLIDTLPVQ